MLLRILIIDGHDSKICSIRYFPIEYKISNECFTLGSYSMVKH